MKEPLSDAELARMQQLCDAATAGPWKACIEGRDHESGSSFIQTMGEDIELSGATPPDYDFIASARQDVPRLVEEVLRLRAEFTRLAAIHTPRLRPGAERGGRRLA